MVRIIVLLLVLVGMSLGSRVAHGDVQSPLLWTVTVGAMPGQVVIDARTNRAFVNNYNDMSVSVLDADSGKVLRTHQMGDYTGFLAVDEPTNRVFAFSDDSYNITLLDATSGNLVGTSQDSVFDTAVDPRTGTIYGTNQPYPSGSPGASVDMLDGRTGDVLRSTQLAGPLPQGVALDAQTGRVFVSNWGDNTASMIEARSGRLLRTVRVGTMPLQVAVDAQTGRVFIPNNGTNTVSMLDARTGAVLRAITVGMHPAKAVVDERTDRVFIVHGPGLTLGANPPGRPTVEAANSVGVSVLDARTGAVLHELPLPTGGSTADDIVGMAPLTNIAVDVQHDRVFVINQTAPGRASDGDGSVSVLDAQTGSVLRTIPVGRHPLSLAVDETTARLFVVNTNAGCARATCPGSVSVIDTAHL
jgi:YVTN family beta-propeller protein